MERDGYDKITAFDTLFTTNHIQMLKILMPYFEQPMRKQLAVYIKFLELRYALSYYDPHTHELYGCAGGYENSPGEADPFGKEEFNIGKICSELLPYCTNDEKQKVEQISGLFRSMKMYKEMSQTFEMMKDIMPDFASEFTSDFMSNATSDSSHAPFCDSPDRQPQDNITAADKPETSNSSGSANQGNNMIEMLMNMLSPEQKAMLEMFGGNHSHESE